MTKENSDMSLMSKSPVPTALSAKVELPLSGLGVQASGFSGSRSEITRRRFLAGSGVTALGLALAQPSLLSGAAANAKVNIGLIGCGGRGQWIIDLFHKHGGYNVVAAADYFQERVDQVGEKFKIEPQHRYTGLAGYRRLLEQNLDAVVIQTPPYFHPEQAAAA